MFWSWMNAYPEEVMRASMMWIESMGWSRSGEGCLRASPLQTGPRAIRDSCRPPIVSTYHQKKRRIHNTIEAVDDRYFAGGSRCLVPAWSERLGPPRPAVPRCRGPLYLCRIQCAKHFQSSCPAWLRPHNYCFFVNDAMVNEMSIYTVDDIASTCR
jgi:hypothetical protein